MPHRDLIDKQQAAYLAASLMDQGHSPRSASKIADISRRECNLLKERQEAASLRRASQLILLEFLQAAASAGVPEEDLTPEELPLSFPVGEPGQLARDLANLKALGYDLRGHKDPPPPPEAPEEPDDPEEDPEPADPAEYLRTAPHPAALLRSAVIFHWLTSSPYSATNPNRFIHIADWPSRPPKVLGILAAMLNEFDEEYPDSEDDSPADHPSGPAADFLIPYLTEPETLRISCPIEAPDQQGPPPQGHAPWPAQRPLYIEFQQPLYTAKGPVHGLVAMPYPSYEPDPRAPWLTALVLEHDGCLTLPTAVVDPSDGATASPLDDNEHNHLNPELHLRITAAAAEAVSHGINPEPLTRQQRRALTRRGLHELWHQPAPRPNPPPEHE